MTDKLPIHEIIPKLKDALRAKNKVVLQAPPGAGKTTVVPLELLNEPWLNDKKILMLEPRRLAARASAQRMALTINEKAGETVGYRVKLDSKISGKTKIEVVTEGILIRRIQNDPELGDIGLIIFDEFHERSIDTDLGLAFSLDIQDGLRDDLKVLIMSATLDGDKVASLMGGAPIITSEGRSYPVEYRYLSSSTKGRIEDDVVAAVMRAVKDESGSILVFLPGAGEIERTRARLAEKQFDHTVLVCPLYGVMPFDAQDRAIQKAPKGTRKIVLSTAIAETSLTIEGIAVVIDSGLQRLSAYDPSSGMSGLETVAVSKASADQRAGRAGRLEAGVCYRLWSEARHRSLAEFSAPEIKRADLVPLALDLAVWGVKDVADLSWLDQPDGASISAARDLLHSLGALDDDRQVTKHGTEMSRFPMHPRLAHMILNAEKLNFGWTALLVAALLEERDVLKLSPDRFTVDLTLRLEALDLVDRNQNSEARELGTQITLAKKMLKQAKIWARQFGIAHSTANIKKAGCCLAIAFPDRIGARRDGQQDSYILSGGRGGQLREDDPLCNEKFIAIGHLDKGGRAARIFSAAPISKEEIEDLFENRISDQAVVEFDERRKKVLAENRRMLMSLPLGTATSQKPNPDVIRTVLTTAIKKSGLDVLPWSKKAMTLRKRMMLVGSGLPDVSEVKLRSSLEDWLGPYLDDISSFAALNKLNIEAIIQAMMSYEQKIKLDQMAPTHFTVPSGSNIAINYDAENPVLAVKLQEMFGAKETPTILNGELPLTVHLLSPAQRPLQITKDLGGFWINSYPAIQKEMKGRYPKHPWPDNPQEAMPTRRVKSRMR